MLFQMKQQSGFGRTTHNEAKMGAYYTEVGHCRDIYKMFRWPEGKVSVLEPSIGDGSAVIAATGADHNENIRIFGVELNQTVAEETKKNKIFEEILQADFNTGVKIRNNVFSFCFGNPPYINDSVTGEGRNERVFLEKVYNYLSKDGICVWIIPKKTFLDVSYFRYWISRFETLGVYQFRADEFAKWHQWCLIGRKKKAALISKQEIEAAQEYFREVKELPSSFDDADLIDVPESDPDEVTLFASKEFHADEAIKLLEQAEQWNNYQNRNLTLEPFQSGYVGQPPIPMKKDSMYLLAVSGCGQGLAGTKGVDLHLQRGIAKVVEDVNVEDKEGYSEEESSVERVTTRTAITMTIIENSGRISHLM